MIEGLIRIISMVSEYYSENALSVRFYDAVTSIDPSVRGDADINFYANCLHSPDQQVLELGCGTGRVAVALAARGHSVTGIDNSEPMLKCARMKSQKLATTQLNNIKFLKHDMATLDLPVRFDLIIVPYYTFNHLKRRSLRARCLTTIANHLLPGARAIVHAASPERLREPRTTRKHVFRTNEQGARLEVTWRPANIDEQQRRLTQIVAYELFAAGGTLVAASIERLTLWWFSDRELEISAQKAGLEHDRTLSSFGSDEGHERIYLLRKQ
jgi:SAM-dependent methyltransferase